MTHNLIDLNLNRTNPQTLRTWLCHISRDKDPTVKLRVSTPQELHHSFYTLKKIDCFKVDGFCAHCKTVFEAIGCFYHYCPCQKARLSPRYRTRHQKERNGPDEEAVHQKKGYNVVEMWECGWWNLYKTTTCVKEHLRQSFPYKQPLREENQLDQIRSGKLFGYVQCDTETPEELKKKFDSFPPILKNTNVFRHDIGSLMQDYTEKERLLCQPRKMLISSYFLEIGTLITPLLLFYLEFGLVCKKIYRFVEYTPVKRFNKFVQSAVDARPEEDENPNSSVVAETMKLRANSFYGYKNMDRSRHTVTKYLNDEKTHGPINTKLFKRLDHINDRL